MRPLSDTHYPGWTPEISLGHTLDEIIAAHRGYGA
jgi:hypothetical protein